MCIYIHTYVYIYIYIYIYRYANPRFPWPNLFIVLGAKKCVQTPLPPGPKMGSGYGTHSCSIPPGAELDQFPLDRGELVLATAGAAGETASACWPCALSRFQKK